MSPPFAVEATKASIVASFGGLGEPRASKTRSTWSYRRAKSPRNSTAEHSTAEGCKIQRIQLYSTSHHFLILKGKYCLFCGSICLGNKKADTIWDPTERPTGRVRSHPRIMILVIHTLLQCFSTWTKKWNFGIIGNICSLVEFWTLFRIWSDHTSASVSLQCDIFNIHWAA